MSAVENLSEYVLGAHDKRDWGTWEVTAPPLKDGDIVTECRKRITVYPKKMLSLQAHVGRSEVWQVVSGTLTICLNDTVRHAKEGETIEIPLNAIHCMANLTSDPVVVDEIQTGDCRESDNIRLMDMAGRPTQDMDHPHLDAARKNYQQLMATLKS